MISRGRAPRSSTSSRGRYRVADGPARPAPRPLTQGHGPGAGHPTVNRPGTAKPLQHPITHSHTDFDESVAAWAFVTGTGWADWDKLPAETTSSTAEFTAYCHGLAIYPDGTAVTLIADSKATAALLRKMAHSPRPPGLLGGKLQDPERRQDGMSQAVFDLTMHHARRLELKVRWVPRNVHPLQAAADQLCGAVTSV
jgi:ribonuclease HI